MVFFDMQEEQHTKNDFYLAQIATEIHLVRLMFSKNPRPVSVEDFLVKRGEGTQPQVEKTPVPLRSTSGREGTEIGPSAVKDPKWNAVNTNAKKVWAARLGMKGLKHGRSD